MATATIPRCRPDFRSAAVSIPPLGRQTGAPFLIVKCLGELGVAPDAAVYVGDTPVDIQVSRAAGVRAVAVLNGAGDSAMLSAHWPDQLLSSHARLAEIVEPA